MAFSLPSISSSPSSSSSSPLIPPPISILPILQHRTAHFFNPHSHLSTSSLQSSNDEQHPESQPPTEGSIDIMQKNAKKKKKKKLRPSFYDQTLERWSLKISSQRSRFPWQELQIKERIGDPPSPLLAGLPPSHQLLESSRDTHLISKHDSDNPSGNFGLNGGNGKLGRSKETPLVYIPLGVVHRGAAPWAHGSETFGFAGEEIAEKNESFDSSNASVLNASDEEKHDLDTTAISPCVRNDVTDFVAAPSPQTLGSNAVSTVKSNVSLIVDELKSSFDQNKPSLPNVGNDITKFTGPIRLPWERENDGSDGEGLRKRGNTELAEKTIPENELQRLRNAALRMKERMKVGAAGVTESVVESIHKKWKVDEVVKLRFEGQPTLHMKRTHKILESKTGGIVIWRSGSSIVLYRGMTYKLPCVQSYPKHANANSNHKTLQSSEVSTKDVRTNTKPFANSSKSFDIDAFLDQLGPRYKDWSGCNPVPIDADMLPGVDPEYKPPFRLLPYKTRSCLKNRRMTSLRRLARTMSPHFALGRNRQHQGLARAILKLWEKSAIAKIAIKRGVPNTCNERMTEEIKKLTGGILLSRNKEYIVFYRGNDFVAPSVRDVLVEKHKQAINHQDEEEAARLRASDSIISNAKIPKGPLLAGTLAETLEANARWGQQPSTEEREKMKRDLALAKHASLVRYLERKLAFAKVKVRKAERALAKVQELLDPAEIPTDLETVTDEERALFRNMGLKMRAYLPLGRRGVFDGTVENMHLNWKHRELAKVLVKGKSFAQVKHIAISLEAESGGVLISVDKTTKGYAIVIYRGKNYQRPHTLRPKNLLTRRQALARAIELQRREALNYHISSLHERIQMLKSQLDKMDDDDGELENEHLDIQKDCSFDSDGAVEDEGEEAYLGTYSSSDENGDGASIDEF